MSFVKPKLKGLIGDLCTDRRDRKRQPRAVRRWQEAQLRHLFTFASQRSSFWRQRLFAALADKRTTLANADADARTLARSGQQGGSAHHRRRPYAVDEGPDVQLVENAALLLRIAIQRALFDDIFDLPHPIRSGRDLSLNMTQFKTSASALPNGFGWIRADPGSARSNPSPAPAACASFATANRPDLKLLKKEDSPKPIGYMVEIARNDPNALSDGRSIVPAPRRRKDVDSIGAPPDGQRSFFADLDIPIRAHSSRGRVRSASSAKPVRAITTSTIPT